MPIYVVTIITRENFVIQAESAKEAEDKAMDHNFEHEQYKDTPGFDWCSRIIKVPESESPTLSVEIGTVDQ